MQLIVEFLPLIAFLAAYIYKDIYFALIVLMIAMPIGLLIKYLRTKVWDKMYLWSTVLLFVMGGITLYFRNPVFFYWKPTAFYWVLAAAFLISNFAGARPFARRFFELSGDMPTDRLSDAEWRGLNLAWVAFFVIAGGLNIFVAYRFSEAVWVNFKVFGLMGLTFVFLVAQGAWILSRFKNGELSTGEEQG